ncbi:MAG: DNA mismatch repair endonuclease MutL [Gracilibacteraceae bacterium]|jgi:DNA mismatch repair protein MutL|nr:DNA mismatch repair endonuclease MutL [Gracilibacteraceae bacterium]
MPDIQILDDATINRIAAGEVVERPVSVVKELVENALDAGAGQIEIQIESGGEKLIRVRDDGDGIRPAELPLALMPHATSKLTRIEDLDTLTTMGFRGEALASIAAVSRLSILSRARGETAGSLLQTAGGAPAAPVAAGCAVGTTVTVEDLFFNTPARRKFLRSPQTEAGLIAEMTGRLALGRPDVAFRLLRGGKPILTTPGNGRRLDVLGAVYGREMARRVIPVTARRGEWEISGFTGEPGFARSGRQGQLFFLQERVIRSPLLARALKEAYHTLLPAGVHPVAVLRLALPPGEADVNVHPAKLEVKFRSERAVEEFLRESVRAALLACAPARPLAWNDWPLPPPGKTFPVRPAPPAPEQMRLLYAPAPAERADWRETPTAYAAPPPAVAVAGPKAPAAETETAPAATLTLPEGERPPGRFAALRPLAQLFRTYILAADETDFYVIDQHAAHERVRYEQLLREARERRAAAQILLSPETLNLSWQEEQAFLEYYPQLRALGFIVEEFGPQTYLLRAVPCTGPYAGPAEVFRRFLAEVLAGGEAPGAERLLERWVFLTACRGAVKAEEILSVPAMEELIHLLGQTENPFTCPHGRPVFMVMSRAELEKRFYRT